MTDPVQEGVVPVAALSAVQDELDATSRREAEKDKLLEAAQQQLAAMAAALKKMADDKRESEERAEAASVAANFSRASSKARYRIMISEAHDPNDPPEVAVQPNGRVYKIMRGQWVDVPQEVVSVLTDAVVGRARRILDPRTGIEAGVEFVAAPRFPFQNLGQSRDASGNLMPSFEELQAAA